MEKLCKVIFRQICIYILLIILPFYLLVALVVLLVCIAIRATVWLVAKFFRPDLLGMLSAGDAAMVFEDQEQNPTNVVLAFVIDGKLSPERIREIFRQRVFSAGTPESESIARKLNLRYEVFFGYPFWLEEIPFELDFHVREYDYEGRGLGLPEVCSEMDLRNALGPIVCLPWRSDKSPWEVLVHPKYRRDTFATEELKSLCILRFSHVMCDAYGFIDVIQTLAARPITFPSINLSAHSSLSAQEKFSSVIKLPLKAATSAYDGLTWKKFRHLPEPKDPDRQFVFSTSSPVSVNLIKEIKNRHKVSFNSVIVSVATAAIQKTIEQVGGVVPEYFSAAFAVPAPNHPGGMVNHATFAACKFPSVQRSAEQRLKIIQDTITRLNGREQAALFFYSRQIWKFYPLAMKFPTTWLGSNALTFAMTSFPAPTSTFYIDDMEVSDCFKAVSAFRGLDFLIIVGGVRNHVRFNFFVERTFFGSEEGIHCLGKYVADEIKELAYGEYCSAV